jgi:DNA-binding CsgD family transcriptional regulator
VPSFTRNTEADASNENPEAGAASDWVQRRVLPSDSAEGLRAAVVHDLMAVAGADVAAYHGVAVVDGAFYFHGMMPQGRPDACAFLATLSGRALLDFMDLNPSAVSAINRFAAATADDYRSNKLYRLTWEPFGFISAVSMNAMVNGTFVGWIGGWRCDGRELFGPAVVKRLQARSDAYVRCLETASRLDGMTVGARGLLLFTGEGEIAFRCEAGRRWEGEAALLGRIRDAIGSGEPLAPFSAHGAIVRVTPVDSEQGERLFCADIVPIDAWQVPELATFSLQQRRVAEYAALGATALEIAQSLGIGASTVRTYLKQIYDKLGIASRVELAEHVRAFPNPASP